MSSTQSFTILHTNDIHSHFEQMAKISTLIGSYRQTLHPDQLLVVDCGDHLDRMRIETEGSDGEANLRIMNATGYEAAVLGNNEGLTFSKESLQWLYGTVAEFPLIGSNMLDLDSGTMPSWIVPYHVVHKGNLRIGIIGVTINYTDFYRQLGWEVQDPLKAVAERVLQLRDKVDVLIVLSHLGLTTDQAMAKQIGGIDLILGGHTHHLLEQPLEIEGTLVCGAGKFGQHVGKIEFTYNFTTGTIVEITGGCIDVESYEPDQATLQTIEAYLHAGKAKLGKPIADLNEPLPTGIERESPLGNLLAAGLKRWTGAEIGLVNAGQLLDGLPAGLVTEEMLHAVCPSPINPCRIKLRGEQLLRVFEEALLPEFTGKPIRGFGFRGKWLGTLCLDGVEVLYDGSKPEYHKIVAVRINGEQLDRTRLYEVGTIDMFTFGVGYMTLKEGSDVAYYLPEFIRDVLGRQLREPQAVLACRINRWLEQQETK